ncbi:MAG TPA: hypothetical protein VGF30_05065, partial [Bacteroidia bacterium]
MKFEFKPELFNGSLLECLLEYSKGHSDFVILNSNGNGDKYELVAAFGREQSINELAHFNTYSHKWKFGYFTYDLKNQIEALI